MNLPIDVVSSVEVVSNPYDPQYGKFMEQSHRSNQDRKL